jgi:hypothetical protein
MGSPQDQRHEDTVAVEYFQREFHGWRVTPPETEGKQWEAGNGVVIILAPDSAGLAATMRRWDGTRGGGGGGGPPRGPPPPPRAAPQEGPSRCPGAPGQAPADCRRTGSTRARTGTAPAGCRRTRHRPAGLYPG